MSEVKRWNLLAEWDRSREGKTEAWIRELPSITGAWVLYADHLATVEALKKALEPFAALARKYDLEFGKKDATGLATAIGRIDPASLRAANDVLIKINKGE